MRRSPQEPPEWIQITVSTMWRDPSPRRLVLIQSQVRSEHSGAEDSSEPDARSGDGLSDVEGEEEEIVNEKAPVDIEVRARTVAVAMASLDMDDLREVFRRRAVVMRIVPMFLRGAFKAALRVALEERILGEVNGDPIKGSTGVEIVHVAAKDDLVPTVTRRESPSEAVRGTVPSFCPRRLGSSGPSKHAGR